MSVHYDTDLNRAMLASGKASTNRPPFNPDGKLATWALKDRR